MQKMQNSSSINGFICFRIPVVYLNLLIFYYITLPKKSYHYNKKTILKRNYFIPSQTVVTQVHANKKYNILHRIYQNARKKSVFEMSSRKQFKFKVQKLKN